MGGPIKGKFPVSTGALESQMKRLRDEMDAHAQANREIMDTLFSRLQKETEENRQLIAEQGKLIERLLAEQREQRKNEQEFRSKYAEQTAGLEQQNKKLSNIERTIHRRADRIEMASVRRTPAAELSFEVALAEHCDLNCAGCDHFSPLAEPEFADAQETSKDFQRLSKLFGNAVGEVHLLGGEPLLHPQITDFLQMARENFPNAVIDITTNGLRLLNQHKDFWLACRKHEILIRPTKYPIPINFEAIEELARQYQVSFRYMGNTGSVMKSMNRYMLDLQGTQNGRRNFQICHRANACIYLAHGKLYTCTVAPTVRHFNRYFGTNLTVSQKDSIDIYQAASAEQILDFLSKPIPFCKYCQVDKAVTGIPWSQSDKDIKEWTL